MARILSAVIGNGQSLSRQIDGLQSQITDERERAFIQAAVYGVLRHYYSLKDELSPLLRKPLRAKDADIEFLLLAALYQIHHMNVPAHAAVSAHVDAARAMRKEWACGLVNAVLRRVLKSEPGRQSDDAPPTHFEHPRWLAERIREDWPQDWQRVLDANNAHPPLTLRINPRVATRAAYLDQLADVAQEAVPTRFSPDGIRLVGAKPIERLPAYSTGAFSVQDEAAQLAARLLDVRSPAHVLDACAAPGGKTTHLLEIMAGQGQLLALDREAERLELLHANLQRLGLACAVQCADAATPASWWGGQPYDAILVDAPCSATGVIRRHPDIRFHRQPEDLDALSVAQARLLAGLWPLLAPGGSLLYVTCSVLRAENDGAIATLLAQVADAEVESLAEPWGRATRFGRQILPGEDDMDGFYFARLRKRSPNP